MIAVSLPIKQGHMSTPQNNASPGPEMEFGVPFPGVVLPAERWSQTALKALPDGYLDWPNLFGRTAPVTLDIGCGNGRSTILAAMQESTGDFLGVDNLPLVIRYARKRGNQRGLTNLKFAVIGGFPLLDRHIAPGSVSTILCYHPQPYYDPRLVYRRLLTPLFFARVHRALCPGGHFIVQTDNPGYWKYILQVAPVFFDFVEHDGLWPDAPRGRTRREIVAMQRGLPIFRGQGTARTNLSEADALALAEALPPPRFDASRNLQDLDRLA